MAAVLVGSVSFAEVTTCFLSSTGRYWGRRVPQKGDYLTVSIGAPAVHGTVQNHHGFRGRPVIINVMYVSSGYDQCIADHQADLALWEDTKIKVDGYENCYLDGNPVELGPVKTGHGTNHWMKVALFFTQRAKNA